MNERPTHAGGSGPPRLRLQVLMLNQDDPRKCTAARMVRLGMARSVRSVGSGGLVLDPFAGRMLLPRDARHSRCIVGIDCSWNLADQAFARGFGRIRRRLPPLLAGNPVNYARLERLTTVEAVAASLIILGSAPQALELLDRFKWGHTFLELNGNLLEEYSRARTEEDIPGILSDFGLA